MDMSITDFQKVLGIDFGTERVGLAISYGTLAEPLTIIANTPEVFARLSEVITAHKVTRIIIGVSENKSAQRTQAFARELQKFTTLPIEFVDETLSTQSARQKLREIGLPSHKVTTAQVDHYAAAEFLQEWLDSCL